MLPSYFSAGLILLLTNCLVVVRGDNCQETSLTAYTCYLNDPCGTWTGGITQTCNSPYYYCAYGVTPFNTLSTKAINQQCIQCGACLAVTTTTTTSTSTTTLTTTATTLQTSNPAPASTSPSNSQAGNTAPGSSVTVSISSSTSILSSSSSTLSGASQASATSISTLNTGGLSSSDTNSSSSSSPTTLIIVVIVAVLVVASLFLLFYIVKARNKKGSDGEVSKEKDQELGKPQEDVHPIVETATLPRIIEIAPARSIQQPLPASNVHHVESMNTARNAPTSMLDSALVINSQSSQGTVTNNKNNMDGGFQTFAIRQSSSLRDLGDGTFGTVKAHMLNEKMVAVKWLNLRTFTSEIQNEIVTLSKLRHPNIVRFDGMAMDNGTFGIVMELLDIDLFHYLHSPLHRVTRDWKESGGMPRVREEMQRRISLGIVEGLVFIHSQNIIHRDIKSLNVLLDSESNPKICDFGLARARSFSFSSKKGGAGTLAYLSPEIKSDTGDHSKASDVYALGVVLFEVFSQALPAIGRNNLSQVESLPKREVVQACLERDPERRPTAEVLLQSLRVIFYETAQATFS